MPLAGALKFRTLIDANSVRLVAAQVANAVQVETARTLIDLAQIAQRNLYQLQTARGQTYLAKKWDHTPIQRGVGGELSLEVYNRAEGETFHARSGPSRARSSKYPIRGDQLLAMLEGGVRGHAIVARGAGRLSFPIRAGVKASDFGGIALTARGVESAEFNGPDANRTLFIGAVAHPGFAGQRFVAVTRLMIEQSLSSAGTAMAQRIVTRLA